jgi:hypothetical protein
LIHFLFFHYSSWLWQLQYALEHGTVSAYSVANCMSQLQYRFHTIYYRLYSLLVLFTYT